MKIKELFEKYQSELKDIYSKEEVRQFFFRLSEHFWKISRIDLALNPQLKSPDDKLEVVLYDLKKQKPWQYITGKTEFFGLSFEVNSHTLIPRPETEELVNWIIKDYKNRENISIIDIGTGSGVIAVCLAKHLKKSKVKAIDISEKAILTAQRNALKNGVKVDFSQKNIFDINNLSAYDLIVSNPPYVRFSEKKHIKPNVLEYEPETALFVPDEQALIFYEKIIELSKKSGKEQILFFEINEFLKPDLEKLILKNNIQRFFFKKDFYDKWRMLKIQIP